MVSWDYHDGKEYLIVLCKYRVLMFLILEFETLYFFLLLANLSVAIVQ